MYNKIKSFKEFLNEDYINEAKQVIYSGSNFVRDKLDPTWMYHKLSNNQEGVGIYFSTKLSTAESYGKNIITIELDKTKLVNSRDDISVIGKSKIVNLLKALHKEDTTPLWYYLTDWGYQIEDPKDVKGYHLERLYNNIKEEQIRNFQVDMAGKFGVEIFVRKWNETVKIDGTYHERTEDEIWFAIINPNIPISQYKENI